MEGTYSQMTQKKMCEREEDKASVTNSENLWNPGEGYVEFSVLLQSLLGVLVNECRMKNQSPNFGLLGCEACQMAPWPPLPLPRLSCSNRGWTITPADPGIPARDSGPCALWAAKVSPAPKPSATVIYVPVSLSSCESGPARRSAGGAASFCFSACLIQTRLTDPTGLRSGSQGARVRGQASRAWKPRRH